MAGVRKKGDGYHCTFRFRGQRFYFALGNVTEEQARARGVEVDEILDLIERGRLTVPEGVALEDFVAAGGKVPMISARPEVVTARQLFNHYLATYANGTVESSSLGTARCHLNQFLETTGERFRIQRLTLQDLQGHVERRRKKGVSPVTLRKELATVRACWNWAVHGGLLKGPFPGNGLRFPKEEEKEPFRTFAERLAGGSAHEPVPFLPGPAGHPEQDPAGGSYRGHQGRGSRSLQANRRGLEVEGAARLPRPAPQLH
jgi:hypothetical protein